MKRLLIISPYFPPVNAADMQRVRISLPYFAENGWQAEVVTVDEGYCDMVKDALLLKSVPPQIVVHKVKAWSKALTIKLGLGSIALRSLWFFRKKVNALLSANRYDLIYFSTTQFPITILGPYWKKKFGVHYVLDIQDPWHSDYYLTKPKNERPPKYWLAHAMNKYMEPIALKTVSGIISVSKSYIIQLKHRYKEIKNIPDAEITFGIFDTDLEIAKTAPSQFEQLLSNDHVNVVYVGRGGADMHRSLSVLFEGFRQLLDVYSERFEKMRFFFIGTSYAPAGQGIATISPLAVQYNVACYVTEITDRTSYYQTLATLSKADALLITGSDDAGYTPSKLYPYLMTNKPMLAILDGKSPAAEVLSAFNAQFVYNTRDNDAIDKVKVFLDALAGKQIPQPQYNPEAIAQFSAKNLTRLQCELFNRALSYSK